MRRVTIALTLMACAAISSAELVQRWHKNYLVGGFPVNFTDLTLDTNNNVYAWGTVMAPDRDVVMMKISPSGSTTWINRLALPGNQDSADCSLDPVRGIYGAYTSNGNDVVLRRFTGSSGATNAIVTYDDPTTVDSAQDGALHFVFPNQIYWVFRRSSLDGERLAIVYSPSNTTTLQPELTELKLPTGHGLVSSRPRVNGGIVLNVGSREIGPGSFLDGKYFDTDVYFYHNVIGLKPAPIGFASSVALDPNDTVYGVGTIDPTGIMGIGRIPNESLLDYSVSVGLPSGDTVIRDAVYTKLGNLFAVGSARPGGSTGTDPYVVLSGTNPVGLTFATVSGGTTDEEEFITVRKDLYHELTAIQLNRSTGHSTITELDELTGNVAYARTYPYRARAHAMSYEGYTVMGGDQGGLTMLQARDFKQMTISPSIVTGGQSADLTIRMYETHGIGRVVTLTETSPSVSVAGAASVAAGSLGRVVTVSTTPVTSSEVVTIMGSYGNLKRVVNLTVNP